MAKTRRTHFGIYKFFHGLHIYGGLFCTVFLLIVGVTALNFQHHFLNIGETRTESSTQNIGFDPALDDMALATAVRDSLGIVGHVPPWDFRSDSTDLFSFKVYRPSRRFDITLHRHEPSVEVHEVYFGAGMALDMLHKTIFGELNDTMLKVWAWYGQSAAVCVLLTILTGIYFWFKKSIRHRRDWFVVLTAGLFSLFFMLFLWLIG